jgi:hypothetical protein
MTALAARTGEPAMETSAIVAIVLGVCFCSLMWALAFMTKWSRTITYTRTREPIEPHYEVVWHKGVDPDADTKETEQHP